jgi:hypothetical protein
MYQLKKQWYLLALALLAIGCANRGIGPQGGPKDTIPPIALVSNPELGALNFAGKRVEITFNEYLQLADLGSNLLMSPPQQTPPDVKARGKRIIVNFQDTLRDSTTYTIDFGSAICDYTEKNPIHGFSFYFSTGDEIDTLETHGFVYDAENLNPLPGIFVGIHSNQDDSAFIKFPFDRMARTDSAGHFVIGNIHPNTYRLYAVDEISRDYRLTPGEAMAYADEPLTINAKTAQAVTKFVPDSLSFLADSLARDTTGFVPDTMDAHAHHIADSLAEEELLKNSSFLFLFRDAQQKLYLQRTLRDKQHLITLLFSSAPDSMPELRPLADSLNYHIHASTRRDTVTLWLLDSASISRDTLLIETRYRRTDSVFNMEWFTDTLRAVWRAPKLTVKAKEAQEREARNRRLELKTNARKGFELYDSLTLTCSTPLAQINRDSIHLMEKVDTTLKPVPFTLMPYDTLPMKLTFVAPWKEGAKYVLKLDSAALTDVYGITHIEAGYNLEVKQKSDYSTLRVKLVPYLAKARLQLLNKQDKVLRELPADPGGAFFEFLKPDTYYLRLYIDENGDGKWTTGDWQKHRQPEPVYYFNESIQTKSNWDFEQEWDYTALPQTKAKPQVLIKASANKKK